MRTSMAMKRRWGEAFTTILNTKGEVDEIGPVHSVQAVVHRTCCRVEFEAACRASLKGLVPGLFDLYLVHWPSGFVPGKGNVPRGEDGKVLQWHFKGDQGGHGEAGRLGSTKAIGMSNYNSKQLRSILSFARIPRRCCRSSPTLAHITTRPHQEVLRETEIQMVAYFAWRFPRPAQGL